MDQSRPAPRDDRASSVRGTDRLPDEGSRAAPATSEPDPEADPDVDEASKESFPASDPPAWNGMPPGGPRRGLGARRD